MKKLSKIKLQDAVVLESQEMKKIFGGSGTDTLCGNFGICHGSCSYQGRSGVCTVRGNDCGCLIKVN